MPSLPTLLAFSGAALVLLVIPGPAVLYIVTRAATQGRRAGLVSVLGVHAGTLVHVAAAVAGLSALLAASATAFTIVKLAGAAYLVWLGVQTIRHANREGARRAVPSPSAQPLPRVFLDALVLNVLNPKTALFFVSFVPQFVDPGGATTSQILVLSSVFIGLGLVSDAAYALGGSWIGQRLVSPRSGIRKGRIAGATYVGLGAVTAVAGGSG